MQANFVVLGSRDVFWKQQSNLNNSVGTWFPLALGVIAVVLAGIIGGMLTSLVAGLAIAFVVLNEPRYGLYLVAVAIAADPAAYDPLTEPTRRLYLGFAGFPATPIELLILWTGICWIIRSLTESKLELPSTTVIWTSIAFSLLLAGAIFNGVNRGGDFTIALWETRALLAVPPLMLITCGLLRERRHVVELVCVALGAITLMSLELVWRYFALVRQGAFNDELESAFNHDGAMLVALLSVAGMAAVFWGPNKLAKLLGLAICVFAFIVVLTSRRRAALVGIEAGIIALAVVMLITNWRRFAFYAPIVAVLGVLYLAAFWNNGNALGQPARVFRTVFISDSASTRDRSSDEYRAVEKYNLWAGVKAMPLRGHGFGVPYPKPLPMADLSSFWPFWDYIAHNTVLWLWHKGGVFTFMTFWFLVGTAITEGVRMARRVRTPLLTAIIGGIFAYLVMTVMFAYVDLGLASTRPMLLFGICLGLLFAMERIWHSDLRPVSAGLEGRT